MRTPLTTHLGNLSPKRYFALYSSTTQSGVPLYPLVLLPHLRRRRLRTQGSSTCIRQRPSEQSNIHLSLLIARPSTASRDSSCRCPSRSESPLSLSCICLHLTGLRLTCASPATAKHWASDLPGCRSSSSSSLDSSVRLHCWLQTPTPPTGSKEKHRTSWMTSLLAALLPPCSCSKLL